MQVVELLRKILRLSCPGTWDSDRITVQAHACIKALDNSNLSADEKQLLLEDAERGNHACTSSGTACQRQEVFTLPIQGDSAPDRIERRLLKPSLRIGTKYKDSTSKGPEPMLIVFECPETTLPNPVYHSTQVMALGRKLVEQAMSIIRHNKDALTPHQIQQLLHQREQLEIAERKMDSPNASAKVLKAGVFIDNAIAFLEDTQFMVELKDALGKLGAESLDLENSIAKLHISHPRAI
ncbi:hypothetical protein CVT24_007054 [Panaeolus cyanescens]|uniref:Uncharacterized protein n=1 Tax=Panaeolus cyanescens TaxID=181874 RepID=A0A409VJR1_9AGAR|nr:hypothetical protein CVT24_007054 [Panaeolus cyanescens]